MKFSAFLVLIITNQYASAFASPVIPLYEKVVIPLHERVLPQPSLALGAHSERWSKQDIFTFIGVVIAIVTVIIGLAGVLVSSPKLRVWLCKRIKWFLRYPRRRNHELPGLLSSRDRSSNIKGWKRKDYREVRRQLQERYDELLKTRRGGF